MAEITGIVLGNIGSGKSTFLKTLEKQGGESRISELLPMSKGLQVEYEAEPVLKLVMEKFYPALASGNTDLLFAAEIDILWERYLQAERVLRQPGVVVTERCLFEDRFIFTENLVQEGKLHQHQFKAYRLFYESLTKGLPSPDFVIYLYTDPEVSHQRMLKRGRESEKQLPLQYLKDLHQHYEYTVSRKLPAIIPGYKDALLVINANEDMTDSELEKFHRHVEDRIVRLLKAKG
jgi:deoxyadenosine/deoxycytidine kinase